MANNFHSWHKIGFSDPKNVILRAIECYVSLGNISHGVSHRKGFTTSIASKLGLKSPILAEKAQNVVIFDPKLNFQIPKILISYT